MNVGILGWQNEHGLTAYPFEQNFPVKDFIVDASFVQFDGFVPTLVTVNVTNVVVLSLTCDIGNISVTIPETHIRGTAIKIMDGYRYIGKLTIGWGMDTLLTNKLNAGYLFDPALSFLPIVVKSIPTTAGVYSLDGAAGELTYTTAKSMRITRQANNLTWTAVSMPAPVLGSINPLRTISGMPPVNNDISFANTDVIKITPGMNSISINIASSPLSDKIVPQKKYV